MHRVLRFPRPDLAAGRHPGMRATAGPFAWLALGCALLLLTGCPLFGGKDGNEGAAAGKRNNSAFEVTLQGEGVSETGPLAYRVDLVTTAGPGQPLELSATLDGKPLALAQPPTSSEPEVVRVDGPDRLTALRPGTARITVVHQENRAELVVKVETDESAGSFQVTSPILRDETGPVAAFTSDDYEGGAGQILRKPKVWVTILGPGGKPVPPSQCMLFSAKVTPDTSASGWENDDRGLGGVINFEDVLPGHNSGEEGMKGCGFRVRGTGFPIIGSGAQEFQMDIYWSCVSKTQLPECGSSGYPPCAKNPSIDTCGKPLPGGSVKFAINRQSLGG